MKKLIVLPGNSIRNKEWGEGVISHYQKWFPETYMQYYDHWQSGGRLVNFEKELSRLGDVVSDSSSSSSFVIVAKSLGSILTLVAVGKGIVKPEKCIFFGMPLEMAADGVLKNNWELLEEFEVPTLAFHNDADPTANFEFTKNTLKEHAPNINLIKRSGDNHNYDEFDEFDLEVKKFLQV